MAWDYLQEENLSTDRLHYCTRENWDKIDVELSNESVVTLTKKEWRVLRGYMSRHEFDDTLPAAFETLPDAVVLVVRDWLGLGG